MIIPTAATNEMTAVPVLRCSNCHSQITRTDQSRATTTALRLIKSLVDKVNDVSLRKTEVDMILSPPPLPVYCLLISVKGSGVGESERH